MTGRTSPKRAERNFGVGVRIFGQQFFWRGSLWGILQGSPCKMPCKRNRAGEGFVEMSLLEGLAEIGSRHTRWHTVTLCYTLLHPATMTHCYTLLHPATIYNTLQDIATPCHTLPHPATPCHTRNALQHTATPCTTPA